MDLKRTLRSRQHPVYPRVGSVLCLLPWLGLLVAACSSPPPRGNLQYLDPDTYSIGNPSRDRATATGIGCAFSAHDARQRAEEVSQFNLRRLTGDARYNVQFTLLKETDEPNRVCFEHKARAVPSRLN